MTEFTIFNEKTAPEDSRELLEASLQQVGMIANLHGVMAGAPALLRTYRTASDLFKASSLYNDEQTVVWQTVNVENNCEYCVPAHTVIAKGLKVDDSITDALRNQTAMPNARLQALHEFTLKVVRKNGAVSDADVKAVMDAGFNQRHLLEVVLGVAMKVMSNYTNSLGNIPLDSPFEKFAWKKNEQLNQVG